MGLLWFALSLTVVGIPLAGIALAGWMLTAADNLRAGRDELPPPGLYLRRGYRLFIVQLAYLLALVALAAIPVGEGFGWAGSEAGCSRFSASPCSLSAARRWSPPRRRWSS